MPLKDYIEKNFKSQVDFAVYMNVARSQVQRWITDGFIVVGNKMYSPRRVVSVD